MDSSGVAVYEPADQRPHWLQRTQCLAPRPLQLAIQAAGSAGMELKNIMEFYRQWKEIG